jgi:hypothetical protein
MVNGKSDPENIVRAVAATLAVAGLVVFAGSRITPFVPLSVVAVYGILGAAAVFLILTLATIVTLTVMQFVLRKGGTDPQWFWFRSDPPGLVALRAQARSSKN